MAKKDKDNKKRKAIIIAYILGAIILIDLTPLGGNIPMYVKAMQCGHLPLQSDNAFRARAPHYTRTSAIGILRGSPPYFCTPEEAERAGFSATEGVRTYPHLPEEEQRNAIEKSWRIYE